MKRVVSVSLGSSKRDHRVQTKILNQTISIERVGTDGDFTQAVNLIKQLDGKVDAIGLGGIDLYLCVGTRRYTIRDAVKLARSAVSTPVVDGSGLKNTLERKIINQLVNAGFRIKGRNVLLVSGVDRFGMAESLADHGARITFGDLIFGLGIPIPIRSLINFRRIATIIVPIVSQMPFNILYPIGNNQNVIEPKYSSYYLDAEIIAGDFHFIKKYLPEDMTGKIIITNTVTEEDIQILKDRKVDVLITTTPELEGRSFGTNVMEAVLVALADGGCLKEENYNKLINDIGLSPRIEILQEESNYSYLK